MTSETNTQEIFCTGDIVYGTATFVRLPPKAEEQPDEPIIVSADYGSSEAGNTVARPA